MDMRAGTETALARVVAEFGAAKPHWAYLVASRRASRMKVLVHEGVGIWLAARRLNQGRFFWTGARHGTEVELDAEQLQALVRGLSWQCVGADGIISMLQHLPWRAASAIGPSVYRRQQPYLAKSAA
jgi:transposase